MLTSERAHARTTDPETSHAAAASVGDLRLSQSAILAAFRQYGAMTDETLVEIYSCAVGWQWPEQSASGIRSRRAELVRLGLVEHTGEKRPLASGRLARVWRAC